VLANGPIASSQRIDETHIAEEVKAQLADLAERGYAICHCGA
jgi:hypothetical protein